MTEHEHESPSPQDATPSTDDTHFAPREPVTPKQPRRLRQWGAWVARGLLLLLVLLGSFLSVVPAGRTLLRGAILLPGLLTTTEPAPLLVAGEPISHTRTTIPSQSGPVFLDVFAPLGPPPPLPGAREAVVMITGVGENRSDPQLITLSESLAHLGIVVVNMTTPQLISFAIQPADEDAVVQSFRFAAHQPGVNPRAIGIVGFSGGAALACLAAADLRIREQILFLLTFGAFYDAADLLRDVGRRAVAVDGRDIPFYPGPDPLIVMAHLVGGTLPPGERHLLVNGLRPGGTPLADPDRALTTPGAAAAYHLIAGDEPALANVQHNLAMLSPAVKQLLAALSPSRVFTQIRCPIYLLHSSHDPYVPVTEGRDFDAALTRMGRLHEYVELGSFHHTQIISSFGIGPLLSDAGKLYRILIGVLGAGA